MGQRLPGAFSDASPLLALAVLCGLVGCGSPSSHTRGATLEPAAQRPARPVHAGQPHWRDIHSVYLAHGARAALSIDDAGDMRLWPTLDGSVEPVAVPLSNIVHADLAVTKRGFGLVAVDDAGATHLVDVHEQRARPPGYHFDVHTSLPPALAPRAVAVWPGGSGLALVAADHSVRLLSNDGRELARWQPAELRIVGLVPATPDLMAISLARSHADGDRPHAVLELHRLRLTVSPHTHLQPVGRPMSLTVANAASDWSRYLAVAPDGQRAAWLQWDESGALVLVSCHLATGVQRRRSLPLDPGGQWQLGFLDRDTLFLTAAAVPYGYQIDLRPPRLAIRPIASPDQQPMETVAFRHGLYLSAKQRSLVVHEPRSETIRYLGFEAFSPTVADISPDGRWVAWGGSSILIEPTSTPTGQVPSTGAYLDNADSREEPSYELFFVSDDRLLRIQTGGTLELMDWRTGQQQHTLTTDSGIARADLDRRRGLLTLSREGADTDHIRVADTLESVPSLPPGDASSLDRQPAHFAVHRGSRDIVFSAGGDDGPVVRMPLRRVRHYQPSPDGRRMAVLRDDNAVLILEREPLAIAWLFDAPGQVTFLRFSPDGRRLLVLSSGTGAIYDLESRALLRSRCTGVFTASAAPPAPVEDDGDGPWSCR